MVFWEGSFNFYGSCSLSVQAEFRSNLEEASAGRVLGLAGVAGTFSEACGMLGRILPPAPIPPELESTVRLNL